MSVIGTVASCTDVINLTVEGVGLVGDLVYQNDAVAVDGPDQGRVKGGVEFTLKNLFNSPVTIDSITIDPLDDSINVIRDRMTDSGSPRYSEISLKPTLIVLWTSRRFTGGMRECLMVLKPRLRV
ncbi:hypothetical protein [Archaeoglobus sp.]